MDFDISWLSNPEVFSVGELPAYSDHEIYATPDEAKSHASSLVRCLNGMWKAHFAVRPSDAPDALLAGGALDETLSEIPVPGEFQLANPEWDAPHYVNVQYPWDGREALEAPEVSSEYNPTVTVVRNFVLSEEDLTHQLVLTFEAAEAAIALWVNGKFIGYAEDSFTPHHFDITGAAAAGTNRIAARIFKRCTGSWMEDQDFWRFSGIHRSVTLTLRPKTHLRDIFVHTPLKDNYRNASLEAEIELDHPGGTVEFLLTDAEGSTVLDRTISAAAFCRFSAPVPGVRLWSAEDPNLYALQVILRDGEGQIAEVSCLDVGFRQFEMIGKIMHLNGKRIVFHGVNRHEFNCDLGRVMTDELLLKDIRDMKGMNINSVRTCHYPNDSRFYKLCDKYGLYVIDETNMETHGSWSPMHDWQLPGDKPEWLHMVLHRGQSMQERDKNHACILLWSCGNESYGGTDILALSDQFRRRDPSRLVHYEGVANEPRFPETSDVFSRMYYKAAQIEEYLNNDPQQPYMSCEYTHAMGNSCGGMSLYTELEDKYPMYQGGFIWDYVDQGLRVKAPNGQERLAYGGDFGDRPTDWQFNTNGIILGDRTFTPKVQEVRYLFRDIFLVPDRTGIQVTNRRLFAPLKELNLHCTVLVNRETVLDMTMPMPEIPAGEAVHVPMPFDAVDFSQETVITAFAEIRRHPLLPEGFAVSHGQTVWNLAGMGAAPAAGVPQVVRGDCNIGVYSPKLSAMFGKAEGGIFSFRDQAGHQCLLRAPKLSLFRAYTDNDHGNKNEILQGIWHMISRYSRISGPDLESSADGSQKIRYSYTCDLLPDTTLTLDASLHSDQSLDLTLSWPGAAHLPDMPAFGLSFQLDPRLHHVKYFGLGPDSCYIDRSQGGTLGWFSYDSENGMTKYEKPQESGSRMNVREMTITGDDGHGIRIEGSGLEVSVLPYLPEELACVYHWDELHSSCRTVLDIAMFRKGIGGDDSWGAPVLPQFTYPADRPYQFTFRISAI